MEPLLFVELEPTMVELAAVALATAIVTTAALVVVRPVLAKRLPDVPNARSSHVEVVPRGGGIAVLAGVIAGSLVATTLLGHPDGMALFVVPLTLFALLGLAEDLVGLSVRTRLLGQLTIGALCAGTAAVVGHTDARTPAGCALMVLVALTGVFYVNAANFVDGVNGISGLHGLLAGSYFALLGVSGSAPVLTVVGLLTAVGFAAFLPWNVPRAALFLGDVGSYLLGGAVWLCAVGAVLAGVAPLVAVAPLAVYTVDVVATLVRRLVAGRSLVDAHREHTYQRIQQVTGSHLAAAFLCAGATALCAGVGWCMDEGLSGRTGSGLIVVVAVGYLALPRVIAAGRRHRMAAL